LYISHKTRAKSKIIGVPTAKLNESFVCRSMIQPNYEILVELTGIEPVASWLQTRRSPS
jgi:hypothetical protein